MSRRTSSFGSSPSPGRSVSVTVPRAGFGGSRKINSPVTHIGTWNSTRQPPVKYVGTLYSSVARYSAASGQDAQSLQADPQFMAAQREGGNHIEGNVIQLLMPLAGSAMQ